MDTFYIYCIALLSTCSCFLSCIMLLNYSSAEGSLCMKQPVCYPGANPCACVWSEPRGDLHPLWDLCQEAQPALHSRDWRVRGRGSCRRQSPTLTGADLTVPSIPRLSVTLWSLMVFSNYSHAACEVCEKVIAYQHFALNTPWLYRLKYYE